jgi:MerR family Zn(II)-responsive transcriptional regulator of zntA
MRGHVDPQKRLFGYASVEERIPAIGTHTGRFQSEAVMLTIGKLAASLQVSADSIRFYEREGLLHPAKKSAAGYRLYTEESVRRLNFIKHAQQCGFSLREIRELLEIKGQDRACCNDVYRVAIEKKLRLESKIKAFNAMSRALTKLIEICSHDARPLDACPILSALESSMAEQHARSESLPYSRTGGNP